MLEAFEDPDRRVGQVAMNPFATSTPVTAVLEDGMFQSKPTLWLARMLLRRLQDPASVVRKRVAWHVEKSAVALARAQPDTAAVVATLVDVLEDPLDANAPDRRATTPRYAALRTLHDLAPVEPALVADHVTAIAEYLTDDDRWIPNRTEELRMALHDAGALAGVDVPDAVQDVLEGR